MIKVLSVVVGCFGLGTVLGLGVDLATPAQADPDQNCTPPETLTGEFGLPIGSRTTCFNPDGSYVVCNFHIPGALWPPSAVGDGPPQCNYRQGAAPAAPAA
jgi:hypothetical protein